MADCLAVASPSLSASEPPTSGRHRDLQLVPVREDLLCPPDLHLRTGKIKSQFTGSAGDLNLDGGQTAPLHSQVKLLISFFDPVALKAAHD